jgi:hypothetical protein
VSGPNIFAPKGRKPFGEISDGQTKVKEINLLPIFLILVAIVIWIVID